MRRRLTLRPPMPCTNPNHCTHVRSIDRAPNRAPTGCTIKRRAERDWALSPFTRFPLYASQRPGSAPARVGIKRARSAGRARCNAGLFLSAEPPSQIQRSPVLRDPVVAEGIHVIVLQPPRLQCAFHPRSTLAVARVDDDRATRDQFSEQLGDIVPGAECLVRRRSDSGRSPSEMIDACSGAVGEIGDHLVCGLRQKRTGMSGAIAAAASRNCLTRSSLSSKM